MPRRRYRGRQKREERTFVFEGPRGRCPGCGGVLPIRICSLLSQQHTSEWTASVSLLTDVFGALKREKRTRQVSRAVYNEETCRTEYVQEDETTLVCKTCSQDQGRLYWIEISESQLVGPLCMRCLQWEVEKNYSDANGVPPSYKVFSVLTSKSTVGKLLSLSDEMLAEEESVDSAEVDDDSDLF